MLTSPLFIILCWYFNTYKKYDSKMCFRIVAYAVSIMLLEQISTIKKKLEKKGWSLQSEMDEEEWAEIVYRKAQILTRLQEETR